MITLPPLRDDLQITNSAPALDGSPQWTLTDTVAGRYFKLNAAAIRLLRHWSLGQPEQVLAAANQEAGLPLSDSDLGNLLHFLRIHDLIAATDTEQRRSYPLKAAARRTSLLKRILHQYLFFRIPLWRPEPFLNRSWPWLRRYGTVFLRWLLPVLLLCGLFLVSRDWPRYRSSFSYLFSLEGMLAYGLTLICAKFLHELGHAYMAKKAGCRVQSMGVAFIVMFPLFYTDVSDAWRLKDRHARLLIGAGGILAELLLAMVALFVWPLLPEGPLHTGAFLLSSVTWITTLMVNINPLMRFDGYFILSDFWQVDNLQGRAYALCRWFLREKLFGYGLQPPENWSPRMRHKLLLWGYASWLWRFFLFFGIALTVYHYFFKVLGIFLMLVEIGWFITLPIVRELVHWWQQRAISDKRRVLRTVLLCCLPLVLLFIPWRSHVEIPAILESAHVSTLYAPVPAQILKPWVSNGQFVQAGQLLAELTAPDLNSRLSIVRQKIATLQLQLHRQAARKETVGETLILEQQLAESLAEYRGLAAQHERLQIRAPQAGQVRDLLTDLTPGRWVAPEQPLLRVVEPAQGKLRGYLREDSLQRLQAGDGGQFIADDPHQPALPVRIGDIDPTGAAFLQIEELTSDHGGSIAVRRDEQHRAEPVQACYGVSMTLTGSQTLPPQPLRGVVIADGKAESLISSIWRRLAALGVRESGF